MSTTTTETVNDQLKAINCPTDLAEMLQYRRPAWGDTEQLFIEKFITPLNPQVDDIGNQWVIVGENPTIMFSSHTDTVHKSEGMQRIEVADDGWIGTATGATECLGADCTAGVWMMIQMIKAEVPGVYVFHRAEEIGGVGSRHVAKHQYYLLDGIQAAIAFDRRGFKSIITRQSGGRCCSDDFAKSLGEVISGKDQKFWELDTGGSFTDTASYREIIPECTNLSIGYQNAHTANECVYFPFLVQLRDALVTSDWSGLVIKRDPKEVEKYSYTSRTFSGSYGGLQSSGHYYDGGGYYPSYATGGTEDAPYGSSGSSSTYQSQKEKDLKELVRARPDLVVEALVELGISADELIEAQLNHEVSMYKMFGRNYGF